MAGIFNPNIFNNQAFNTGAVVGPIFNMAIFNVGIFNTGDETGVAPPVVVAKTGTGGIDPGEGLRRRKTLHLPVKPTGLLERPKAKDVGVQKRLDETGAIQAEIAGRLAREFGEETAEIEARPVTEMSMAEVEAEIGFLLKKKLRNDEEEVMLLLLMVAAGES